MFGMKDDKTARDQRSRDMNPTYHQFWESRGLGKLEESDGKLGPEVYATGANCGLGGSTGLPEP